LYTELFYAIIPIPCFYDTAHL